jgi:hypothetical protein
LDTRPHQPWLSKKSSQSRRSPPFSKSQTKPATKPTRCSSLPTRPATAEPPPTSKPRLPSSRNSFSRTFRICAACTGTPACRRVTPRLRPQRPGKRSTVCIFSCKTSITSSGIFRARLQAVNHTSMCLLCPCLSCCCRCGRFAFEHLMANLSNPVTNISNCLSFPSKSSWLYIQSMQMRTTTSACLHVSNTSEKSEKY